MFIMVANTIFVNARLNVVNVNAFLLADSVMIKLLITKLTELKQLEFSVTAVITLFHSL